MQVKKNYTLVTNIGHLQKVLHHIEESDYLAFDTETTGLNVRKDKVIGFGVCGVIGEAYYIPMFKWDVENQELVNIDQYSESVLNALKSKNLIMHNGSYDIRICQNDLGISFKKNLVADTILMWHTVNEEGPFGLKDVCSNIQDKIGYDVEDSATKEKEIMKASIEANGGSATQKNYELYKADWDKIGYYCCADVDMTLRLFEYCYDLMEHDEELLSFFFDVEVMPLYRTVTIRMEEMPVKLDMEYIMENYNPLLDKIAEYETKVIGMLLKQDAFHSWLKSNLDNKIKYSPKGKFGNKVIKYFCILDFPTSPKTGKFALTKKNIQTIESEYVREFLLGNSDLNEEDIYQIKELIWCDENDKLINLNSKTQMKELFFDHWGLTPLSYTKKKAPQFNDEFVDSLEFDWATDLKIFNRLNKVKTYFDRFIEGNEDGNFYFSYKQHGTISGRYGSDAQQLPRPMEEGEDFPDVIHFSNMIRRFFISGEGRLFIDADYESLEPHVFAHVSGDEGLRDIFRKGHDFYSTIAIATEKLKGVSADKKADNYLGKVNKPLRQSAKAYSLGVPYGMGGYALGKTLEVSQEEAERLIRGYLGGFPNLEKWMKTSEWLAKTRGYVKTESGRVRHLPKVKELYAKHRDRLLDYKYRAKLTKKYSSRMGKEEAKKIVNEWYKDYKNGLNNAKNVQIQGLSASIVNRSMIAIQKYFDSNGIDAWVCSTIHDQIIVNVPSEMAEDLSKVVESIMTTCYKLSIDLKSPPEIGDNWRDTH